MSGRPTSFPSWATAQGALVQDPGDTKQADGWVENERPPAHYINWYNNLVGQWFAYLKNIVQARNFSQVFDVGVGSGGALNDITWAPESDTYGRYVVVYGSNGEIAYARIPEDGWTLDSPATTALNGAASDGGSRIVVVGDSVIIYSDDPSGSGWTSGGNFLGYVFEDVVYSAAEGAFYAAGTNNGNSSIVKSTDGGDSWSDVYSDTQGIKLWAIAADSNGGLATVGEDRVLESTDNGATWDPVAPASTSITYYDVTYDTGREKFYAIGYDSGTSETVILEGIASGVTWSEVYRASSNQPSRSIAAYDGLLVADNEAQNTATPLSYSTDGGVSWETVPKQLPTASQPKVRMLREAFWALPEGTFYQHSLFM